MRKTAPYLATPSSVTVAELERLVQGWLLDSEYRQLSPRTLAARRNLTEKFLWYLRQEEHRSCGKQEIRAFLAYVGRGHESPGGRWGNAQMTRAVRPSTTGTYYNILRSFFRFLVEEGALEVSPMDGLRPPISRSDQVQPFTEEQVNAILAQARKTPHPTRDQVIVLFLLDTGARASEVCDLRMKDLDLTGRRCTVQGKGNKSRRVYFGQVTAKALWSYLKEDPREPEERVFVADRGTRAGEPLTRSGLGQLIRRLGRAAGVEATRSSPHTFRHTFAVSFLRAGGNVFTLKELLGHTTLAMVNRYVALAQADLEAQHRQFSPADRLKKR